MNGLEGSASPMRGINKDINGLYSRFWNAIILNRKLFED